MNKRIQQSLWLVLSVFALGLSGCSKSRSGQDNLHSVLWVQTSAEYAATTTGIYAAATRALQDSVEARAGDTERMVIVMDLDETIVDNSRFKAHELQADLGSPLKTWDEWITLQNATAVPGAIEFIEAAQGMGVKVMIVTNRRCVVRTGDDRVCPQEDDTLANLRQLGLQFDGESLFLRGERSPDRCVDYLSGVERLSGAWATADKASRRSCVMHDYDIVMMFGDQLSDFVTNPEVSTLDSREASLNEYEDRWGKSWFLIPNPTYGTWLRLLYPDKREHLHGN
jgi:acid phosphatase